MLQSNRADISMFESMQANQHAKTGVSQMAVFNDLNALKAATDKYTSVAKAFNDKYLNVEKQIQALYDERSNLDNNSVTTGQEAKRCMDAFDKEVVRIASIPDEQLKQKELDVMRTIGKQLDSTTSALSFLRLGIECV
jgi:prophage DNA circulation protein